MAKLSNRRITKKDIQLFQDTILQWFQAHGRHHLPWRKQGLSAYEIIIAEVLLQRTKAGTIERFYEKFLTTFPGWRAIANADILFLEQELKPVGLYRQRARRLQDLAQEMVKRQGTLPVDRMELEQIPFLGQYIINAIELQVFYKPSPLLDVNMARVIERYFGEREMADIRYDPYLQKLAYKIVNHSKSKEVSWAILDFAAAICKAPTPLCLKCPLIQACKFPRKNLH
ncbi:MAG: hypothetical protein ACT6QS_07110 [Flavobacteriales bacterium]